MLTEVRNVMRDAVRSKIAGPDADERAAQIWLKPGGRRFVESDPIWRVHSDVAMFAGGVRALLLQSLHPLAMAGVSDHSGYRSDPYRRLQRTSDFIAQTTFAVNEDADRAVRVVQAVHRRIVGMAADGRPYDANDPHLLMWVHAAEIDSFLQTYQRFGAGHLGDSDADEYVAQTAVTAEALGVIAAPRSVRELHEVLESFRPELASTPASRDVARFLLWQAPIPLPARPAHTALALAAASTLPAWALRMLGIPRLPVVTPVLGTIAGVSTVRLIRWIMSAPPRDAAAADLARARAPRVTERTG